MNLKGIYPAVTTPFAADGSVAISRLRENIARYNRTRIAGYVLNGSTGESVLLRWEESSALGSDERGGRARENSDRRNRGGIDRGNHRAHQPRRSHRLRRGPCAHAALLQAADDARRAHRILFARGGRTKIPVWSTPLPIFTQLKLQADVVGRVAQHPNIIGMKDSSGDAKGVKEIMAAVPKIFKCWSAPFPCCTKLCKWAAWARFRRGVRVSGNVREAYEASRAGDAARATATQLKLVSAANLFGPKYGIAGLKYAMDCVGYYGGPPRPPLLPVDEAAKKELDAMLASVVSEAVAGDLRLRAASRGPRESHPIQT